MDNVSEPTVEASLSGGGVREHGGEGSSRIDEGNFSRILPDGRKYQSAYSRVLRVLLRCVSRDWVKPLVSQSEPPRGGEVAIPLTDQWPKDCLKSEGSPVMGEIGFITRTERWLT